MIGGADQQIKEIKEVGMLGMRDFCNTVAGVSGQAVTLVIPQMEEPRLGRRVG